MSMVWVDGWSLNNILLFNFTLLVTFWTLLLSYCGHFSFSL